MQIKCIFKLTTALSFVAHIIGLALLTRIPLLPRQQPSTPETAAITLILLAPQIALQEMSLVPSPKRRTSKYLAHQTQPSIAIIPKGQTPSHPDKKDNIENAVTTTAAPPPNETFSTFTDKKFQDTNFSNTAHWAKELSKKSTPSDSRKTLQSTLATQNEQHSMRAVSEKTLNKAARTPCSQTYMSMGLLAIPLLLKDSVTDTGCVW